MFRCWLKSKLLVDAKYVMLAAAGSRGRYPLAGYGVQPMATTAVAPTGVTAPTVKDTVAPMDRSAPALVAPRLKNARVEPPSVRAPLP